jgi:Pup amidohydrolase
MADDSRQSVHVPKVIGADIELGNFILGLDRPGGTSHYASRALLAEIEGFPCERSLQSGSNLQWSGQLGYRIGPYGDHGSLIEGDGQGCARDAHGAGNNAQDWGRKFLASTGGCAYIDLDHLEICTPEVRSAWDFVAVSHAMLRVARSAQQAANTRQAPGRRIQVHANNSDGLGNSYGSHLNFLVTRRAWDNIFTRKLHQLLWLASYQASSIIFTGQGKVGSEDHDADACFQLAQRTDFLKTLVGPQTTYDRPLVNSRDEALCGCNQPASSFARLHAIFFDNTLCHVSTLLKVGVMQIVLAQVEAEHVNPDLILDDPVGAAKLWSRDPSLTARARTASGKNLTAAELQMRFLEDAHKFAARTDLEGIVPRAGEILSLWEDTLGKLQARDMAALAPRLDWVLKHCALERALQRRKDLDWASPEIKCLDQMYSSLDESEGLYWAYERKDAVDRVASDAQIDWFTHNPPEDSRAWTRAMLLRVASPEIIDEVSWDFMRFRFRDGYWHTCRRLELADPLGFTRALAAPAFDHADRLDDLLDALTLADFAPPDGTREVGYAKRPERKEKDNYEVTRSTKRVT